MSISDLKWSFDGICIALVNLWQDHICHQCITSQDSFGIAGLVALVSPGIPTVPEYHTVVSLGWLVVSWYLDELSVYGGLEDDQHP